VDKNFCNTILPTSVGTMMGTHRGQKFLKVDIWQFFVGAWWNLAALGIWPFDSYSCNLLTVVWGPTTPCGHAHQSFKLLNCASFCWYKFRSKNKTRALTKVIALTKALHDFTNEGSVLWINCQRYWPIISFNKTSFVRRVWLLFCWLGCLK